MKNVKRTEAVTALMMAAVILLLQAAGFMAAQDNWLKDTHYQKGGLISPDLYVIGIDEETLMEYGPWQSWGRERTAQLLRLLNRDADTAPAVIGLDIGFFGETGGEADQELARAASLLDNVVTTTYATFGKTITETNDGRFVTREAVLTYEEPYDALKDQVSCGFSNVPLDPDGIVRHSLYSIPVDGEKVYSFAAELYRRYWGELPAPVEQGKSQGYIPFAGRPYDYYGTETAGLSFSRVLEGEIPAEMFAGSIVLIGPYSTGMMDSYYTAVSHDAPMFGVEVHANILQAFLDENNKTEPGRPLCLALTAVLLAGAFLCGKCRSMKGATASTALLAVLYWLGAGWCYDQGIVLPLLYPLGGAALFYVYRVGWQYVTERLAKKRIESIFGRYVSDQVVSNIIKDGEEALKLGGQKRDIAVLFVDIRGFTPLSESLPPEQVVEILNRYLSLTTKAVFDNGGTVDKFIGDATMAVYNAPLESDDYVFRAVKTGLDMARAADALEQELSKVTDKKVGFGIGINCGEAVIGNIGTPQRMEYTAIGNTVNTAARLESQAKAGEVVISQEVYDRLKGRIRAVSLGKCRLKGIAEEAEVYRVEGIC